MPYYAVHRGKFGPNIYKTWSECESAVKGYDKPIFKKFDNKEEAEKFKNEGFGDNKPKCVKKREDYETKNQNQIESVFTDNFAYKNLIIYTDGSCLRESGNNVYCGYGIVIPEMNMKIAEDLKDNKQTNNRAEMMAILDAIERVPEEMKESRRLCIFTDSQYCKYIFEGTGERYEKDGYMKSGEEVPNKDMIKKALEYKRKYNIVILKVRAHTDNTDIHSKYNDIADKLANEGALKMKMGKKYKKNDVIENMNVYHDSIIHPFEKKHITKSSTPEIEYVNNKKSSNEYDEMKEINSYRYNDDDKWREEEKKKFVNKTKMSDLFEMTEEVPKIKKTIVQIRNNKMKKFEETNIMDFLKNNNEKPITTKTKIDKKSKNILDSFRFSDDD